MPIHHFQAKSFICPWCRVHATMTWQHLHTEWSNFQPGLNLAYCANCEKYSIWKRNNSGESVMIYPLTPSAPRSNPDMPDDVEELYCEAANISVFSHRGAAAILRLCLEKLCNELTNKEDTIDHNLKRLAESDDPIPGRMLKMAHFVRVMGNEAVHPGKIDFNDNPEIVKALFTFINLLVDNQITQLERLDGLIRAQPHDVQKKIMKHENRP